MQTGLTTDGPYLPMSCNRLGELAEVDWMRAIMFLLTIGVVVGLALCTYLFDSVVSALGLAFLATFAIVGLVMVATASESPG